MSGKAAFSDSKGSHFAIRDAPDWPVQNNEIKIRVRAAAVNPADYKILDTGFMVKEWPIILGDDVAGEVVKVGSSVSTFKVGDRVAAVPASVFNSGAGNQYGGFQEYTVVQAERAFKIPDGLSFEDASVFPLAIATAAPSLFSKDRLALQYPQVQKPASNGKTLLVWGGSSSVGACAIQLAAHAGYEVFATASKRNFDLVRSFGASQVFDYTDEAVITNIVNALKGKEADYAGAFSATQDGQGLPPAVQVAAQLGLKNSFVATTNPRVPQDGLPEGVKVAGNIATQCFEAAGPPFPAETEVGKAVFSQWLPEALAAGTLKISPPAKVVGHGLEVIDEAVDLSRKGRVSGQKIVVTL